jgi:putative GTP pyrophosphokinase
MEEFEVVERSDKGRELIEEERFGYQSVHYLVRIKSNRARLAEYERFGRAITEVQVRTILQHAWAEIEHDIQYKSTTAIPVEIRRRFMLVAGMLEIADREFQAIQDEDRRMADRASDEVRRGDLSGVEITPNALKVFLDEKMGPDDRISDWTYDWTTRLLKRLGFRDLKQVETAIAPYDDYRINLIAFGNRQGQVTRFESMLLAALAERFIERHPWSTDPNVSTIVTNWRNRLAAFEQNGIRVGTYDPISRANAAESR